MKQPDTPDFQTVLGGLQDTSRPLPMASLYHLSDLSRADLAALEDVWPQLPDERRLNIAQNLNDIAEANFEVSFDAVFRMALEDESPAVRAIAIRGLWEDEDPRLIATFLDCLHTDPDLGVRAAAATALGRFVYLSEIEEIPASHGRRVEDALLQVISGSDDLEVRRRALEAVAYSSRPEVPPLIADAYASPEPKLRVSAVFAMGRNADAARWGKQVRAEMESSDPEMRYEAARAAGELELQAAARELADLTQDDDAQVQEAAIWSLGQIGGTHARATLERLLENATDDEEAEFIQEALDNLDFTDEVHAFSMLEFGEDGEADELDLDELDEDDEEELDLEEFEADDEDER